MTEQSSRAPIFLSCENKRQVLFSENHIRVQIHPWATNATVRQACCSGVGVCQ